MRKALYVVVMVGVVMRLVSSSLSCMLILVSAALCGIGGRGDDIGGRGDVTGVFVVVVLAVWVPTAL